jgi:hypothetical protein
VSKCLCTDPNCAAMNHARPGLRAEVRRLKRLVSAGELLAMNLKGCRYGKQCPGCVERADAFLVALSPRPRTTKRIDSDEARRRLVAKVGKPAVERFEAAVTRTTKKCPGCDPKTRILAICPLHGEPQTRTTNSAAKAQRRRK